MQCLGSHPITPEGMSGCMSGESSNAAVPGAAVYAPAPARRWGALVAYRRSQRRLIPAVALGPETAG
jgi:hypothetical protein